MKVNIYIFEYKLLTFFKKNLLAKHHLPKLSLSPNQRYTMENKSLGQPAASASRRLALIAWTFYDFGNSAFASVIQTFVFAAYFVAHVAPNTAVGTAAWGSLTGMSAFVVALISPICGAIADQGGRRKSWLAFFTLICIVPTAMLWFVRASPDYMWFAIVLVSIGGIGAEGSFIFYNAMLPELSPSSKLGRWSGFGWGMGYLGGMSALIISLFILKIEHLNVASAFDEIPIRLSCLMVAVWYAAFSIPLFLFAPSSPASMQSFKTSIAKGFSQLGQTFSEIRKYRHIVKFLIAKMFYVDGLATLFAFGGIYAATTFKMDQSEVIVFGILMNLTAGFGAATLAFLDDWLGSWKVIMISIIGMIIPGAIALAMQHKIYFWVLSLVMCLFVGPLQSSSRSLMSRIAPENMRREMFGFYMFSGKATAFIGPLLYGWATYLTGSIKVGMSTPILLFIIGGFIMMFLPQHMKGYIDATKS